MFEQMLTAVESRVVWTIGLLFAALIAGTIARLVALRSADSETRNKRLASLRTWWILSILLAVASFTGLVGVAALLGLASVLAIWELGRMVTSERPDRHVVWLVMLAAVVYYVLLVVGLSTTRLLSFACCVGVVVAVVFLLQGKTTGYVRATAGLTWGFLVVVVGLSHAALLVRLPESSNPVAGPVGWFLYLVVLTESNDIFQALIGRRLGGHGKHRISPRVSPNKTWEGFIGGAVVTVFLAWLLAPALTPLHSIPVAWGDETRTIPWFWSVVTGLIVAVPGFFGDINMSAVKRDAGVKDSSNLLPGMGGVIDRIDSLTFVAPAFYYLITCILPTEAIQ